MPTYVLNSDEYKKALQDKTLTKDDIIELKSGKTRPPNTMKEMKAIRDYELKLQGFKTTEELEKAEKKAEEPEELIIPKPIKSPENLTPVIGRIKDDVEELRILGKTYGGVYQSDSGLSWFAYLAILRKFESKCFPIYSTDKGGVGMGILLRIPTKYKSKKTLLLENSDYLDNFGSELEKCINRKTEVIPIYMSFTFTDEKKEHSHANMLIYRPFEKIVERFEPHGSSFRYLSKSLEIDVNESIDGQVKEIFERLEIFIGDVKYVPPNEICPIVKGFQSIESQLKKIDSGFCLMWSLFFMEMVLYNPTKTSSEIISDILKLSQDDPQYMTDVIRGYVMGLEKMLDETLKFFKREGFSFAILKSNKDMDKETFTKKMIMDFTLDSMFDVDLSETLSEVEDELQKLKIDYNERNVGKLIDMLYNFPESSILKISKVIFGNYPNYVDKNTYISNIIIDTYKYEKMDDLLLFKPESMSKFRNLDINEKNEFVKKVQKILVKKQKKEEEEAEREREAKEAEAEKAKVKAEKEAEREKQERRKMDFEEHDSKTQKIYEQWQKEGEIVPFEHYENAVRYNEHLREEDRFRRKREKPSDKQIEVYNRLRRKQLVSNTNPYEYYKMMIEDIENMRDKLSEKEYQEKIEFEKQYRDTVLEMWEKKKKKKEEEEEKERRREERAKAKAKPKKKKAEVSGSGSEYTEKKKCKLTGGMVCECQKISVWDWF